MQNYLIIFKTYAFLCVFYIITTAKNLQELKSLQYYFYLKVSLLLSQICIIRKFDFSLKAKIFQKLLKTILK